MTVWRILRFEVARWLRRPALWGLYVVFAALGFGAIQAFAGVFDSVRLMVSMGGETLRVNSPYLLSLAIGTLTALGLPLTAALFGSAVHREVRHGSGALLWTTPLGKWSYWSGRFGGALTVNLLLLSGFVVGVWLGTRMPWIDPELVGAERWMYYLQPFVVSAVRRTLLAGALVVLAVWLVRNTLAGYLALVALIGLGRAARQLTSDLENRTLAALLDPTGSVAAGLVRRSWSTAEKNTQLLPLEGPVGANLLLWSVVALGLWLIGGLLFRPESQTRASVGGPLQHRLQRLRYRLATLWRWLGRPVRAVATRLPLGLRLAFGAYLRVVSHPMFLATLLFGLVSAAIAAPSSTMLFGTPTWPVTYAVLAVISAVFEPFAVGIAVFFTGFLLWRNRDLRLEPLIDSTPRGPWLPITTCLLAMAGVLVTLQTVVLAAGAAYQSWEGHHRHEWSTYLLDLYGLRLTDLFLVVVLALFLQVLLLRRYLAYLATAVTYLGVRFAPSLGLDHVLYRYGQDPGYILSELNGVRDFMPGWWTVKLYWLSLAALMILGSILLWPRGEDRDRRSRLARAKRRWQPSLRAGVAVASALLLGFGAVVFYNTNLLRDYRSPSAQEAERVAVETELRSWLETPQPRITEAKYRVELYPSERRAEVDGELQLVNPSDQPVTSLLLQVPEHLELLDLRFESAVGEPEQRAGKYREWRLDRPLAPGAKATLTYRGHWQARGFANQERGGAVLANGTFIGPELTLGLGYSPDGELTDPRRRRRYGLPPRDPMPRLDDARGQNESLSQDADWMHLEIEVGTEADQVALAPGDLVRQWSQDGRRYFAYRSPMPVQNLWSLVSGRYEVHRDTWNGIELEIYHHPEHTDNLDSMVRGMKKSLDFLTRRFGEYPHRALRIVEFPRYANFAMSLPGLIPFSEGIGFIARKRDADDIDYPLYVTAHEVAHQWFPHQVSPANVEGMAFLSETFSQYVALRVMEEQFGPQLIGKFLRYELDRYLLGRSVDRFDGRPLYRVHQQQHIYYNKGSLAIYAAADLLGRETLDRVLAEYLEDHAFRGPPYPTSEDFLARLEAEAKPEQREALADLFERITFYDLAVEEASCSALEDGRYRVDLSVRASKTYADGTGVQTPAPLSEDFEVGVFAEKKVLRKTRPKTLRLEQVRLDGGRDLSFEVDQLPLRAGIDPFYKRIDTDPLDNVVDLECDGA